MGDSIEPTVWVVPQGMTCDQAIRFLDNNKRNLPGKSGHLLIPIGALTKKIDEELSWEEVVKLLILGQES